MAPRGQDLDAPNFVAADVIGSEGIGHHGELLLDALAATYPPELQAVLQYRPNDELDAEFMSKGGYEGRLKVHAKIAKVAEIPDLDLPDGRTVKGPDRVLRARIRGGADENGRNRDSSQAWVSYVALDDTGDNVFKGVFPFLDLDKSSSDGHFSQLRAAAETPAGRAYLEAKKKEEAGGDSSASAQSGQDPVQFLQQAPASEVIALMEAHPERADAIKALYADAKGSKAAKSVLEFDAGGDGGDDGDGGDENPGGDGGTPENPDGGQGNPPQQ